MRVALFAVLGLVFGSFLTVLIYRVPRRESIVWPGSRCPSCGTPLRAIDNIPVLSYLLLRRRCRACREPISIGYPLVELGSAVLFVAAALVFEDNFRAGLVAPFLSLMLAVAVIDARLRIVPNRIVYPALLIFAVAIVVGDLAGAEVDAPRAGLGMLAYSLPLFLIDLAVPQGMGMGDVKLVTLVGLVLGSLGLDPGARLAAPRCDGSTTSRCCRTCCSGDAVGLAASPSPLGIRLSSSGRPPSLLPRPSYSMTTSEPGSSRPS